MASGVTMQLGSKKLFVFDFDGTLANTLQDITTSVNHVRSHLSLSQLSTKEVTLHIGKGQGDLVRGIAEDAGTTQEEVLTLYREHHEKHLLEYVQYYPGVAGTIRLLKKRNNKIVILSNKFSHYCREIVAHLKPRLEFDLILGPDSVPQRKPDPSGIFLAAEELGIGLEKTVMIGDSEYDIKAGINAGVTTVACLYGYGDPDLLKEISDFQVGKFSDIEKLLT